jgi:hypothetical protein
LGSFQVLIIIDSALSYPEMCGADFAEKMRNHDFSLSLLASFIGAGTKFIKGTRKTGD